jgi:hypothetical protein
LANARNHANQLHVRAPQQLNPNQCRRPECYRRDKVTFLSSLDLRPLVTGCYFVMFTPFGDRLTRSCGSVSFLWSQVQRPDRALYGRKCPDEGHLLQRLVGKCRKLRGSSVGTLWGLAKKGCGTRSSMRSLPSDPRGVGEAFVGREAGRVRRSRSLSPLGSTTCPSLWMAGRPTLPRRSNGIPRPLRANSRSTLTCRHSTTFRRAGDGMTTQQLEAILTRV